MKISKKMSKLITILTEMLGILFATTMVFAAGTYVMPSAVTTGRKHEYPILELDGKILQSIQVLFILLLIILLIWTIVLIKKI